MAGERHGHYVWIRLMCAVLSPVFMQNLSIPLCLCFSVYYFCFSMFHFCIFLCFVFIPCILDFKLSPCFTCKMLQYAYCIDLPKKMEPIEGSETSAISTQTPGKHPKENILLIYYFCFFLCIIFMFFYVLFLFFLLIIFVFFYFLFVLCRSLYCLFVYVYWTTATGWLPNCIYKYHISYHIIPYHIIKLQHNSKTRRTMYV
jgi:hypothetical protein